MRAMSNLFRFARVAMHFTNKLGNGGGMGGL
jgi:hypothetical protein